MLFAATELGAASVPFRKFAFLQLRQIIFPGSPGLRHRLQFERFGPSVILQPSAQAVQCTGPPVAEFLSGFK